MQIQERLLEKPKPKVAPQTPKASDRLLSLDVFRGITLFVMCLVNNQFSPFPFLEHAAWNGMTMTDLVFPNFLFAMGFAHAIVQRKSRHSKVSYSKILRRSALLVACGLIPNITSKILFSWPDVFKYLRFAGVLQRIGLCYFLLSTVTSICPYLFHSSIIMTSFSLVYLFFMLFASVPNCGAGVLTPECNFGGYFDTMIWGSNHNYRKGSFDPEGLFTTLSAVLTSFLGYFLGRTVVAHKNKGFFVIIFTLLCLVFGFLFSFIIPVNKALWTTSYVFYAGFWAGVLFYCLYYIIDVWKFEKLFRIFKIMGSNSLIVFLGSSMVTLFLIYFTYNCNGSRCTFYGFPYHFFKDILSFCPKLASLFAGLCHSFFFLLVTFILYKKKIFIKV
ncbi:hypothetical protein RCL1_004312 [Eukaryota sp. TZLM3-RCL]